MPSLRASFPEVQRKRLALISALLAPADILLLDEPTNHLDNEMADWLEDYLKKWKGALVMVTHDRYFLDSVTNRIAEIDKGAIYSYQSNYSGFLELKTQREEMEDASERKRQSILRVELEWIRRGPGPVPPSRRRIFRGLRSCGPAAPVRDSSVELGFHFLENGKNHGGAYLCLQKLRRKEADRRFQLYFPERGPGGIYRPNGCGKTTLMKIIAGLLPPDSGQVVVGQTVKMGYYAQRSLPGSSRADVSGGQSVDAFRGQSTDAPGAMTIFLIWIRSRGLSIM